MQSILVTGGAGFIGSHVCDKLLFEGFNVVCVDNFNKYYDPKIKNNNIRHNLKNKNYKCYKADIINYKKLAKIFSKHSIDKIIHLAARAGVRPSIKNPFIYEETNVKGTLNLLELARINNVKKFVFGSSSSVYGTNKKKPFSEKDSLNNIISPYAATKKMGEELCRSYHNLYNLNITCLRFFTVYGPRGRPDMAPYKFTNLINNSVPIEMYGDGNSARDYTYISDIVEGIISANKKTSGFEIINLGDSNPVKLKKFISIIEKEVGKKAIIKQREMPKGDVPITYADIKKADKLLKYKPKIKIEEGIKRFVEWYKNG
ncbi:epimerase [Candidatus Woesearchaeota archaeon]|nr:epimerase [Candidatus Woesearchaeota archaeon]